MEYKIILDDFEGPMDLLLHLIKQADIDIFDISILDITRQYLNFIEAMEEMNLNIASEYLIMAAELIEMKSNILLPKPVVQEDQYEENPREKLIQRLLEYQKYKEITPKFKELEQERKLFYTKDISDLREFIRDDYTVVQNQVSFDDFLHAIDIFLERKKMEKPLNTKITKKEYSVSVRSNQILSILKEKKGIEFRELLDVISRDYIVVSFLSILDLARKQEIVIKQEDNFESIYLSCEGCA